MEVNATIYARPETEFWDEATLDRYGIAAAFCLYLVPDDGKETVDVYADPLENVFHFWTTTPDHLRDEARENLAREGICGPDYLMRDALDNADPRLLSRLDADLDEDEELSSPAALDALREAIAAGRADDPEICNPSIWAAWRAERIARRRARNLPPLANFGANGLDNLPLFVAAANRIMAPRRDRVKRFAEMHGDCAASRLAMRPLERLNWAWPL